MFNKLFNKSDIKNKIYIYYKKQRKMEGQAIQEHNHTSPAVKEMYDKFYHRLWMSRCVYNMKGFHSGDYDLDENGRRIIKIIFGSLHSKLFYEFYEYLLVNDIEYKCIDCRKTPYEMYPENPSVGYLYIITL